mmetsp:Transcript_18330/g.39155  ORF Transcript_18330/g.39155 Transcript_18330/m.39155 type:complete len:206 (-) Transcript_18330:321-938(-)
MAIQAGLADVERHDFFTALHRLQKTHLHLTARILAALGGGGGTWRPMPPCATKNVVELGVHLRRTDPLVSTATETIKRARPWTSWAATDTTCRCPPSHCLVQGGPLARVHQGVVGARELGHLQRGHSVPLVQVRVVLLRQLAKARLHFVVGGLRLKSEDCVGIAGVLAKARREEPSSGALPDQPPPQCPALGRRQRQRRKRHHRS